MNKINKKMFGKQEIYFPTDEEIVVVVGENGSGKTQLLKNLNEYWVEQGEEVIYFPAERMFSKESYTSLWYLLSEEHISKYGLKKELMRTEEMAGQYIHSGYYQLLNFFGTIMNHYEQVNKEVIVIIDEPERNLSLTSQRALLEDILSMTHVKQVIAATHSPYIICNRENGIDIKRCFPQETNCSE